ncbi:DUF4192 domain-containing protein [Pedococcus aerophilus]
MEPIRLAGPADVLAVLPYQLGYHPSDSLVAIALRDRQIGLVERIDLPPDAAVPEACAAVVPPLVREDPDGVLLVGYESSPGAALPLADAVRDDLVAAGVQVLDRLVVRAGRWYAPDCDTGCCPTEGQMQEVPRDAPAVAQFVALEVSPLPGRESLATLVALDPERAGPVAQALAGLGARSDGRAFGQRAVDVHRLRFLATWAKLLDVTDSACDDTCDATDGDATEHVAKDDVATDHVGAGQGAIGDDVLGPAGADRAWSGQLLTPDEVALLVVSLRDVELRDGIIAWICPGTLPLDVVSPDLADALHSCLPQPAWEPVVGSVDPATRERGAAPDLGGSGRWSEPRPTTRSARRRARARRAGRRDGSRPDSTEQTVVAGRRVLARLQTAVRAVPDEEAAALLTVLANLAWWLGDGALTRVALDRALEHTPGYRLAVLLERMVDLGVRPRAERGRPASSGTSALGGGLSA